jgi:hypothetical protein
MEGGTQLDEMSQVSKKMPNAAGNNGGDNKKRVDFF